MENGLSSDCFIEYGGRHYTLGYFCFCAQQAVSFSSCKLTSCTDLLYAPLFLKHCGHGGIGHLKNWTAP